MRGSDSQQVLEKSEKKASDGKEQEKGMCSEMIKNHASHGEGQKTGKCVRKEREISK
jgi:hypothetical protein